MEIIVSPRGIVDIERPGQGVMDLSQAGFGQAMLDFTMCCPEYELESVGKRKRTSQKRPLVSEHPEKLYDRVRPILDRCTHQNLRENRLHLIDCQAAIFRRKIWG